MKTTVYLDNNATTPVDPEVVESMMPFLKEGYFNPSSLYSQAEFSKNAIEKAREEIADFIGAESTTELIFTGSASESNNAAIMGVLKANPARKHIITTTVEHPAILELCKDLARDGYDVTFLDVDSDGNLDIKDLINTIRPDTAVVSIMHANNETGVVFPIETLSRIVKQTDPAIVFHTDATQTVGKIPIDLSDEFSFVDMLTFSGHKLYAPKGVGVLYNKRGTRWRPFIIGGHQEKGRRAGTENVPYIVGLAKACTNAQKQMEGDDHKLREMRDKLESFVRENIPSIKINGEKAVRLDSTTNISFQAIEGEAIIYALNEHGICASTGSACSSGNLEPSHVLKAYQVPFSFAHGSIRFSFGRFNTEDDLNTLIKVLPEIIGRLRTISPFWDNEKNEVTDFKL